MKQKDFEQLDELAWDIVCNWYKNVDFNPVYDGVDFSLLTRALLRSKIGLAIRVKNKLSGQDINPQIRREALHKKSKNISIVFKSFVTLLKLQFNNKKRVCYIPQYARPIHSVCAKLFEDKEFLCVTRDADVANRFVLPFKIKSEEAFERFIHSLYEAICSSLEKYDLQLKSVELKQLQKQIYAMENMFIKAKKELNIIKPDVIILYSDESLPQMCYALLAKQMGIKTISLQHGLDCEILYLDEPYADLLLLWGEWRKDRYKSSKNIFDSQFEVVGNPEYDKVELADSLKVKNEYWLWVTRPHSSDKCYSPSRLETEGVDILSAIVSCLKKYPDETLVIKPHPYDNIELYRNMIEKSGIKDRIQISVEPPMDLYREAKLVITEDSTAGLEALMFKKKIIHVNFAMQPVSVPLSEYNVALLARSFKELDIQLDKLMNNCYNFDLKYVQPFISDFLYALDGNSTKRAVNCIKYFLEGNESENEK